MKKHLLTVIIATLTAVFALALFACDDRSRESVGQDANTGYALEFSDYIGGVVSAEKTSFELGETVTLSVKTHYGYEFTSLKVGGEIVTVENGAYSFAMPAKNVVVEPQFTCTADTKQLPNGSSVTVKALAPITGGAATAKVFTELGSDKVTVTAYIADDIPIAGKDGLTVYFGTADYASGVLSASNIAVETAIGADPIVKTVSGGDYIDAAEFTGITVAYEPWSVRGGVVCGYIATLEISYSNLAVDASDAAGKLTLLPYLVNNDNLNYALLADGYTVDDYYSYSNPDTYLVVTASALIDNRYMFGKGAVGSYKSVVTAGSKWNTQKDYETSDAQYQNREVVLTGNDDKDNNIAFFGSAGKTSFVKATFTVTGIYKTDDQFPKFGLVAFDTAKSDTGVFFYVDAERSGTGNSITNITGTNLGYNTVTGGRFNNDWKKIESTSGAFDLTTKSVTLGMLIKGNFVYMFHCTADGDRNVGATIYKTDGNMVIGIKCFALGLKVTNYEVTADGDSELYKSHDSRADGTTIGDNLSGYAYTDGWSITNDVAQNSGRGNQIIYVKAVPESKDLYAHALVTTPGKCGNTADAYTKVGAILENENYLIFGYIDLEDRAAASSRVSTNFAVFDKKSGWTWQIATYSYKVGVLVESVFVDMGIAKLGGTIYLVVNGDIVASYVDNSLKDAEFVVGILGFNRSMTVKAGGGTADAAALRETLGLNIPAGIKLDGVLDDDVWTAAVLSAAVTFDVSKAKGTKVEVVAVKGVTGVYVAVMLYTKTEQSKSSLSSWGSAPNVAFRFGTNVNSQFVAMFDTINGAVSSSAAIVGVASAVEECTLAGGSGYKTTVEFFVPYKHFTGSTASTDKLPFYVWSFRIDNTPIGAMSASSYGKNCFVTAQGLVLENK